MSLKTQIMLSGNIEKVERHGDWTAFVLPFQTGKNSGCNTLKVIMNGAKAKTAFDRFSVGDFVMASGSMVKHQDGVLKVFADVVIGNEEVVE